MLCMSAKSTLSVVDNLGEGHYEQVEEWRDSLFSRVEKSLQVTDFDHITVPALKMFIIM